MNEKVANYLAGTSLGTGAGVNLISFNVYLETATLIVGFAAGIFALIFQARRWYKGYVIRKAVKASRDYE